VAAQAKNVRLKIDLAFSIGEEKVTQRACVLECLAVR
jgi:hypothetical protein